MTAMACDEVRSRLPWLVNDSLDASEAEQLRTHLAECDGCRHDVRELEAAWQLFNLRPDSADVVAAVFESGNQAEAAALERLAAADPVLREELELIKESHRLLQTHADSDVPVQVPPTLESPNPGFPSWLLAASLLVAAVTTLLWFGERQQSVRLEQRLAALDVPRMNTVAADIFPESLIERSSASSAVEGLSPVEFRLSPGQDLTLILSYPQADPRRNYAVRLSNDDDFLWEFEGLAANPTQDFTLTFPPGFLVPGNYELQIYLPDKLEDPDGVLRLEQRYRFRIDAP